MNGKIAADSRALLFVALLVTFVYTIAKILFMYGGILGLCMITGPGRTGTGPARTGNRPRPDRQSGPVPGPDPGPALRRAGPGLGIPKPETGPLGTGPEGSRSFGSC